MKKKLSVIMINRNLKHIAIFFLINTILFLSNCFDTNAKERKKRNEDNKVALLQVIGLSWGSKEVGTVVDNKDGTLTYTYQLLQTNGWLGNRIVSQRTILIRRCLIGQVYRSTQNDCQGTGTKDTVWGASQLQWCPTNDRSCEKDGKADSAISPAAKACATDTFAGMKWELPSESDRMAIILSLFPKEVIEDIKNTKIVRSPIIWLSESIQSNLYPHLALTSNIESNVSSQEKILLFSILCKGA